MSEAISLTVNEAVLKPIVQQALDAVLNRLELLPPDRLAWSEVEAAALLGVPTYTLRDCRRRGEVAAVKIGREYRYTRAELLRFLNGREAAAAD